jgi:hypothetical protein
MSGSPNQKLFKSTYFPPEISSEITDYLPIANLYPGVNLASEIAKRNIPDEFLTYLVSDSEDRQLDITVKGGEVITKLVLRNGDEVVMSTDKNDLAGFDSERALYTKERIGSNYIMGLKCKYVVNEYIKQLLPSWLIGNVEANEHITIQNKDIEEAIPKLIQTVLNSGGLLRRSILYPDGLVLWIKVQKRELASGSIVRKYGAIGKDLDACFTILYRLATVNRYWCPATHYLLNQPVRNTEQYKLK